jgi:hypothetical protein
VPNDAAAASAVGWFEEFWEVVILKHGQQRDG